MNNVKFGIFTFVIILSFVKPLFCANNDAQNGVNELKQKFKNYHKLVDIWKDGLTKTNDDFYNWFHKLKNIDTLKPYINFIKEKNLENNFPLLQAWSDINFWNNASFISIWNPSKNPLFFDLWTDNEIFSHSTQPMLHFLKLAIVSKCFLLRKPQPEINSHEFKIGLGGNWAKGNVNKVNFNYNFDYERLIKKWQLKIFANGSFYKDTGKTPESSHEGNLLISHNIYTNYFDIRYYGNVGSENYRGIDLFTNHGIGLNINLFKNTSPFWFDLSFSVLPLYITYKMPENKMYNTETSLNLYLKSSIRFYFEETRKSHFELLAIFVPGWKNFKKSYSNFRAILESSFSHNQDFNFSLSLLFDYRYYSQPIDNQIEKSDFRLSATVNVHYKN